MDLGIEGKLALITGGSRGLGRQAAMALANEGVNIAICARGTDTVNATVNEITSTGVDTKGYTADMGDESAPGRAVRQGHERHGTTRHTGEQRRWQHGN